MITSKAAHEPKLFDQTPDADPHVRWCVRLAGRFLSETCDTCFIASRTARFPAFLWNRAGSDDGFVCRFATAVSVPTPISGGLALTRADPAVQESAGQRGVIKPAEMGGGDPFLRASGQIGDQGAAPGRIQLAENVVEQVDG